MILKKYYNSFYNFSLRLIWSPALYKLYCVRYQDVYVNLIILNIRIVIQLACWFLILVYVHGYVCSQVGWSYFIPVIPVLSSVWTERWAQGYDRK
jgi:hypothetical protein